MSFFWQLKMLSRKNVQVTLLLPFAKSGLAAEIRKEGTVLKEEYVENGLLIEAMVDGKTPLC